MPRHVIRRGQVVGDIWQVLVPHAGERPETVALPEGPVSVPSVGVTTQAQVSPSAVKLASTVSVMIPLGRPFRVHA